MRLLTTATLALLTLFNAFVVRADSSTFSEDEARPVLAANVQKESQGKITVVGFKKTDGQKSEYAGIKAYKMDFEAQIEFQVNGSWLKGRSQQFEPLRFEIDQNQINKGSWDEFGNAMQGGVPVSRGSRATISGVMTGQRTEKGWKIDLLESHYVSSSRVRTVQPPPQVSPGTGGENPPQSVPMQSANQQEDDLALHNSITKAAASQFSKIVESESQGQIKRVLKTFYTRETLKIDAVGREKYWVTYDTQLEFLADGIWLEKIPGKVGQFRFASFPLADTVRPKGREVHAGDRAKLVGTLIAEKSETGWRNFFHDAYPISFKGPQQVEVDAVKTCINNLRLIDAAKQQWALERRKVNSDIPVVSDILPFCGRGANGTMPTCPSGGTYIINAVGEKPQCSVPNHILP